MMLQLQPFGKISDARSPAVWHGFYRQHELVVLRLKTHASSGFFAETNEPSQLIAKLG